MERDEIGSLLLQICQRSWGTDSAESWWLVKALIPRFDGPHKCIMALMSCWAGAVGYANLKLQKAERKQQISMSCNGSAEEGLLLWLP